MLQILALSPQPECCRNQESEERVEHLGWRQTGTSNLDGVMCKTWTVLFIGRERGVTAEVRKGKDQKDSRAI